MADGARARKTARTKPCAEVAGRSLTWRTWRTWRLCGEFRRLSGGRVDAEIFVLAYIRETTGSHRARAQSAVADGARARNRTLRVHGINATCVTAPKPPFPDSRIMLPIFIILSITKFPPEQRVDQDGMIRSLDRSSTITITSTSTSTKNSQEMVLVLDGVSSSTRKSHAMREQRTDRATACWLLERPVA